MQVFLSVLICPCTWHFPALVIIISVPPSDRLKKFCPSFPNPIVIGAVNAGIPHRQNRSTTCVSLDDLNHFGEKKSESDSHSLSDVVLNLTHTFLVFQQSITMIIPTHTWSCLAYTSHKMARKPLHTSTCRCYHRLVGHSSLQAHEKQLR
ncbi:uncharacterized protein BO97DRAFT_378445 [Aspergillus homomorphus CBS 101889]|uniref:Secreted protein n=1 Tax=Aspergillus homomorphus (strain CBS 101889) TaxID=1450537 RepID=A0A395HIX1_ASPHC|nr:hypothetical protein BO97DRAFT_378445 [Aspergillus homomorphus CBS 101889]RAL07479.1 hypothetical protein BO97DRAFT_378445 [Aspergillus homomorphus CBS 101889]